MSFIECKDVSLSYDSRIVLSELSFSVSKGDYLCILGDNGSGKSTLIKALLLLKNVHSGTITYGDGLKKNEIGYLPQRHESGKDFPASVWEVVLSGCLSSRGLRPFYSKKEKARAKENMAKLKITELASKSFGELSGGQQQRVLLARALCSTKKAILLDEPVSGLDPSVTRELYAEIKKINDEGITVIMVSHDIENALKYSSHVLHLQNKPLFFGKTSDYSESDICKKVIGGDI